ncbi:MAG: GNAT family N-acetyltransferase [Chloroflexota bacterium]|nr:GNAT family N-acetyltransferase [Chloroflexota bacterium]
MDRTTEALGALVRQGDLVDLRRHVAANRDAFVRWYGDREIAEMLRHDLTPLTPVQARGYFDTIILPMSARGHCWAIHDHATGTLIGSTALTDLNQVGRSALFRIVIGEKQFWGGGRGTEATRLVVAEAFERLGLASIRLEVFAQNERARRAYRRVGFHETGDHTEWVLGKRRQLHVIEMEITRSLGEGGDTSR